MAYNPNRCPRCGRNRNRNAGGRAALAQGQTVITDPRNCCATPETVAEELYTGVAPEIVMTTCCDYSGCRECDARCRDPYWPRFCHPRWLRCNQLYHRRSRC